jgi:hypothetical protein
MTLGIIAILAVCALACALGLAVTRYKMSGLSPEPAGMETPLAATGAAPRHTPPAMRSSESAPPPAQEETERQRLERLATGRDRQEREAGAR